MGRSSLQVWELNADPHRTIRPWDGVFHISLKLQIDDYQPLHRVLDRMIKKLEPGTCGGDIEHTTAPWSCGLAKSIAVSANPLCWLPWNSSTHGHCHASVSKVGDLIVISRFGSD